MNTRDIEIGAVAQDSPSLDEAQAHETPVIATPGQTATGNASFLAPLRLANFRRLVAGQTVSRLGDAFYLVAIPWLVLRSTSSPIALTLVLGISAATLGASTLAGGVLADRYGPRALMLGADIARFVIITALAIWALLGTMPFWALLVLTGLLGVASGLFYPASGAMTPHLVPADDLQAANSFDQLTLQTTNFIGPGIAGAVLSATQLAFGFVIDAVSFAASVITLVAIRMPSRNGSKGASAASDAPSQAGAPAGGLAALGEALRFLRSAPFLLTLLVLSLLANFAVNGLFDIGIPLLLKQWVGLSEGPRAQGFIFGGFGLGSTIGALVAGFAGQLRHKPLVATVMLLPVAGLLSWTPFTQNVYLAMGLFAAIGVFIGFSNVLWITLIQRAIPMEMLGRVMSIALLGSFVGTPLSIFAYGLLATVVPNVSLLFLTGGALFGLAGLLALSRKIIWQTE